jgi:beta-lactamase class A
MRPLVALVLAAALAAQTRPDESAEAQASRTAKLDALWGRMKARIEQVDAHLDGVMGLEVRSLAGERVYRLRAGEIFPTASSIKAAILAELGRQNRWNELYTLDAKDLTAGSVVLEYLTPGVSRVTFGDLARFMIVESDNGATNVLIDRLGMEKVNALLATLSLANTRLRRRMIDLAAARAGRENTSTPEEMTRLVESFFRQGFAGAEAGLAILRKPKRHYIPAGLPAGVKYANKPGSLEGVRTDTALIWAGEDPFALSVMTAYLKDEAAGERAIAEVTAAAYEYFRAAGASSVYGRAIPAR